MPPVNGPGRLEDSADRRWPGWLARALIPVIVLLTGLFADTVAARTVGAEHAAQAAAPQPTPDNDRRPEGLISSRHGTVVADHKPRRKPTASTDDGPDVVALPAPAATAQDIVYAPAPPAPPPSRDAAPGPAVTAHPRAPPA